MYVGLFVHSAVVFHIFMFYVGPLIARVCFMIYIVLFIDWLYSIDLFSCIAASVLINLLTYLLGWPHKPTTCPLSTDIMSHHIGCWDASRGGGCSKTGQFGWASMIWSILSVAALRRREGSTTLLSTGSHESCVGCRQPDIRHIALWKDEGKHTGRNDLLFAEKMMWMDEWVWPKMKSECCERWTVMRLCRYEGWVVGKREELVFNALSYL